VTPLMGVALGYALGLVTVVAMILVRTIARSRVDDAVDGWGSRERRQMMADRDQRARLWP
jgi:hypothetical protein